MNDDDLNERCDEKYCTICGPPVAADHALGFYDIYKNPFIPTAFPRPVDLFTPISEDDE